MKFINKDSERHLVKGIVLEPNTIDKDGDYITEADIEEAAHTYLKNGLQVKLSHRLPLTRDSVSIVESSILPGNLEILDSSNNMQKLLKGSWYVAMEVLDTDIWNSIESGEIKGFSIGGIAQEIDEGGE